MKDIIVVEHGRKSEFDNIQDMVKTFLGENYYDLTEEERYKKLRLRTYMNAGINNLPITDITRGQEVEDIEKNQYILLNELTFLLSLAKNNDIVIYENDKSDKFTKGIEKQGLERISENYVRVNDCANQILENEISKNRQLENNKKELEEDEERI